MIQNYTYKLRIYPTEKQKQLMAKTFGCVRFLYNYFLNENIKLYLKNKETDMLKHVNKYDCNLLLTILKRDENYKWLNDVSSCALQQSAFHLDGAFQKFFKNKKGFPKFKKKYGNNSFVSTESNRVKDSKLIIARFNEGIKIKLPVNCNYTKICNVTIVKTKTNKYYASILTEKDVQPLPKNTNKIGVDLGLKTFAILSDGQQFSSPNYYKQYEKKLSRLHHKMSKKQGGSHNKEKARLHFACLHEKIANKRQDFLHKLSTKLIRENQTICLEDLDVKEMTQKHRLAKSIYNASWSEFVRQLEYKASWYDRQIMKIDRYFPSSKTCNVCGWIKNDLTLNNRQWTCSNCHTVLDRDLNAAKNILQQGLNKLNTVGTTEIQASGDLTATHDLNSCEHVESMKEEVS